MNGRWLRHAGYLFRRSRFESELEEEMRLHRELRAAKLREAGFFVHKPDAEMAARRRFGNQLLLREESQDIWGWRWLETLGQDLRYALRQLRKNMMFTAMAVATLALGIGANTAMFTIINGVLLRPLPYPDPDRLMALSESRQTYPFATFSYRNFVDLRRESNSFQGMAAWQAIDQNASMTAPGEAEVVGNRHVSAGFLSVLGVNPIRGREFLQEEDRAGAGPVTVIAYSFWQKRLGGAADAVGKTITLNGKPYTIVGILPPDFSFFSTAQMLLPLGQDDSPLWTRETHPGLYAVGRLKRGVTLEQARSELSVIAGGIAQQFPKTNQGVGFAAIPEKEREVGDSRPTLLMLLGAVGLVLLIACTNVANVMLARSVSRQHEFAIRTSLGAGRGRVIRQLITEGTLVSLLGGIAGLLLAVVLTDLTRDYLPADLLPRAREIAPDLRVLWFAVGASLITGLLFGLAPALQQASGRAETLRQGPRGSARGVRRLQATLVFAQVALTLILLVGAGLMLRTLFNLWSVNPGFDPHHVYRVRVALSPSVPDGPAVRLAWQQILREVQGVPGVESVSINSLVPLSGDEDDLPYWTTPEPPPSNQVVTALDYTPSPDYLRTMRIPLLRGRFFTDHDRAGSEPVVVIDEVMAARAFPNRDALGQKVSFMILGPARVVGIVGHVKHFELNEETYGPYSMEEAYFPFAQIPDVWMKNAGSGTLLVRTSGNPLAILPALRQSILGPSRNRPIQDLQPLDEIIGNSEALVSRRLVMILLGAFAGLALLLASVGIYGVISYSVNQRVQEMGIRLALGASQAEVQRMVIGQGMRAALAGIGAGAVAALAAARLAKDLFYGVAPYDPLTFVGVIAVLALVAFIAAWIPARRASRVDPIVALRYE